MKEREEETCRGGRRGGKGSAQTFRRGRAVLFYQQLETKRETIKRQLESPEFETIRPVLAFIYSYLIKG
mgnify:CR=1 FL=1